eukprot:15434584-Alexandrium_andersonii.AAC.1
MWRSSPLTARVTSAALSALHSATSASWSMPRKEWGERLTLRLERPRPALLRLSRLAPRPSP